MKLLRSFTVLSLILTISWTTAGGAEYPAKPIEMYVGYPPGGPSDTVARLYAPIMSAELGVPVAVVNKPGGGGALAVEILAKANPDGYTICESSYNVIAQRPFTHHVKYTYQDFTYISSHSDYNFAFLVRKDAPWKTFKDWVEYARKNPGTRFASYGSYGTTHLVMEWIARKEGLKVPHVPFKGDGEGLPALLGGHIDIYGGAGMHPPMIEAGKLRTLLQMSGEPADNTKVPYLKEIYPDFPKGLEYAVVMPRGVVAPKGLPAPVLQKLAKAAKKSFESEDFKKFLKQYKHRLVIWDHDESYRNVQIASEALGKFLKEIGFVKN